MTCTVDILLFSVLRELIGEERIVMQFSSSVSGADVLDRLEASHPSFATYRSVTRIAVNQEYVDQQAPIQDGDEVALITPVSGG